MRRACFHSFIFRATVFFSGLILTGAFLPTAGLLFGEGPAGEASPSAPLFNSAPLKTAAGVSFLTRKARLWLGRSQIVCFYDKQSSEEDRFISFNVDEKYLHVLTPPSLLRGANLGYLRVRPMTEGETQITLGGASLDVQIVKDTAASTLEQTRPEIVTPGDGAVVWGKFVVGVEQLNFSSSLSPVQPVLRLPDGRELPAQAVPDQQPGPHLRYAFTVDAASLPPGVNELVAVSKEDSGRDIVSQPVEIFAFNPNPASIQAGDCKDQINTQLPPPKLPPGAVPPAPPKAFVPPAVAADDKSVFGSVVVCPGENPPWCMPVTVPSHGLYEMFVTARGDIGANALPTIGLSIDNVPNPVTLARLATTDWQRLPVGHPIPLEPGAHVLSVRFRNGFSSGPTDRRCLYLARYELVRLDSDPAPSPALAANDPGSTAMQSNMQDAASMQSSAAPATMMQEAASTPPSQASTSMMQEAASMPPNQSAVSQMQEILPSGAFHIVFKDPLQGQVITGQVQLNALCWWPNRDHSPPPTVDLLVNDKVVATQTSPQPQFHVPASTFQPGENKIQFSGRLVNGQRAHSSVESLFLPLQSTIARIAYPAEGAKVGLADAVVAEVSGGDNLVRADLLIDGQPQHLNLNPPNGLGPVLFPLLTRNLAPGPHQLQVAVRDPDGNGAQSDPVTVMVTGREQVADGKYARALFLLNRFGYGPEPRELAAVLTMGAPAWLASRLDETMESPLEENERERLHAEFPDVNAVVPRALQYLLTDANPVRARFVMWTENHFSTWVNKDGPAEKAREHDRFLELGVAPFPDLLLASATSPAMLIYLDQRNSVAHRLNENYAREIMELHTLGVKGGYTQQDVTTLADLLTGWTLADEAPIDGSGNIERTFRYDPYLNSGTPCRILGLEFPGVPLDQRFDRVLTALNMLSAHPSCAFFISRKLVEHYVSDPAPPGLVNDLAQIYLETGGDIRAMLLALPEKPAFWAAPAKVASPIDFGVRLARMAGQANTGAVMDLVSHSGMGLFDRATPDGYPDTDGYFASSNALLQRWHFAQVVQNNFLGGGLIPNGWKPADKQWDPETTQRLVDLAAVRITGNVLGDNSNAAAMQLIAASPENTEARLHLLTTFLCQVPETSIR
jgi:uncharacterized protein (DUF1800 family)